jgi:hypothetical protein
MRDLQDALTVLKVVGQIIFTPKETSKLLHPVGGHLVETVYPLLPALRIMHVQLVLGFGYRDMR